MSIITSVKKRKEKCHVSQQLYDMGTVHSIISLKSKQNFTGLAEYQSILFQFRATSSMLQLLLSLLVVMMVLLVMAAAKGPKREA